MAKQIITIKVEVNNDVEAYFVVNKLNTMGFCENVKVIEANYKNKKHLLGDKTKRKNFLK